MQIAAAKWRFARMGDRLTIRIGLPYDCDTKLKLAGWET